LFTHRGSTIVFTETAALTAKELQMTTSNLIAASSAVSVNFDIALTTAFVPHARHRSGGVWVVQPTVTPEERSEAAIARVFRDYMDNATAADLEGPIAFDEVLS
jgi:hypothetical protein